jgi:hypothetical protein
MSVDYFVDPAYEFVTTTFCETSPHTTKAQLWLWNATSNMLFTASNPNKCLSMVPNAININLDLMCRDAKVEGGVQINGVLRTAYELSLSDKPCHSVLQEYGRWNNQPFSTYSNMVTTYDCEGDPRTDVPALNRRPNQWVVNNQTGTIYNPGSNACLHLGGDVYGGQCYQPTPSPYPAFLFPCDRGCKPEKLQRWIVEPVDPPNALNEAQQLYRIKLRGNPRMCLHNGINEQTTTRWYNHESPLIAGGVTLLLLLAAFVYEAKCSRRRSSTTTVSAWNSSHLFKPGLWWWMLRIFLSATSCFCAAYFSAAVSLFQSDGGRGFYPRQMTVHGNLLFLSMFFVHMVLVARDASYDGSCTPEEDEEEEHRPDVEHQHRPDGEHQPDGAHKDSDEHDTTEDSAGLPSPDTFTCAQMFHWGLRCCSRQSLLFARRCYWFGLVERPSLALHCFSVFFWRGYAGYSKYFLTPNVDGSTSDLTAGRNYINEQWLSDAQVWLWWSLGPITYIIAWTIAHKIAQVRVDLKDSGYPVSFLIRWSCLLFMQWCATVSGLFSPDGSPSWFPFLSINITALGIMWELLLGTISERSLEAWVAKYHVVFAVGFSIPLILVNAWEMVAVIVGSHSNYGQVHMLNVGAIGGDSNQIKGDANSVGWWYGPTVGPWVWSIAVLCYIGIILSLTVLPYLVVWLGVRGPKGPNWLSNVLVNTGKICWAVVLVVVGVVVVLEGLWVVGCGLEVALWFGTLLFALCVCLLFVFVCSLCLFALCVCLLFVGCTLSFAHCSLLFVLVCTLWVALCGLHFVGCTLWVAF